MTLQEAIASGKKFSRTAEGDIGEFFTAEEFLGGGLTTEDYNATDYMLEPAAKPVSIKETILIEAWNSSKPSSVGAATTSDFYRRLKTQLASRGIIISA